ncbi:nucleotidyltransferase family protein [bacterium]|nr:nucleotidyltransferase family protein [bacterium]MBU1025809.1 nucleotidyltransferase family protein [bacterium]
MVEKIMEIPAMILAGGPTPTSLQTVTQEPERAFIPLLGKPIIAHTVDNIRGSMFLSSITVIGNVDRLKEEFKDDDFTYIEDAGSLLENLMNGLKSLEQHRKVLILTADIPLITTNIIASTLLECEKIDADCYYPIVMKSIIEKKFPGGKRTYIPLREGQFSGGNVFLVNPKALLRNEAVFKRLIKDRKNVVKLVSFLGLSFLLMMIFGLLDIPILEKKASKILGVSVKAIISPSAELAVDIDKEKDFIDVSRYMEKKRDNDNRSSINSSLKTD